MAQAFQPLELLKSKFSTARNVKASKSLLDPSNYLSQFLMKFMSQALINLIGKSALIPSLINY